MFVRIGNTPRDYAWGSTTAIAELLGTAASGRPEAELWLGAHAASPSSVLDPSAVGGARDLAEWIERDPAAALGRATRLPFLLKVLAAAAPLSLQAHPSSERAAAGFAAENAAGVPLHSPSRNYKDPFHKPELIYALSDTLEALCGFRAVAESVALIDALALPAPGPLPVPEPVSAPEPVEGRGPVSVPEPVEGPGPLSVPEPVEGPGPLPVPEPVEGPGATAAAEADETALAAFRARLAAGAASPAEACLVLRDSVGWLLGGGADVAPLVDAVVAASARLVAAGADGPYGRELRTVATLAEAYPADPGIVLSLLLNRVSLRRGEVLYLPAGNIHAYLEGLGIELMSASDNVLRGGLTPKHIDVPELLAVLDFAPVPVPYLMASHPSPGVEEFRPDVPDFALWHVRVGADAVAGARAPGAAAAVVPLPGPAIALCVDGRVELSGAIGTLALARGEAVYVSPEEASVTVTGAGTLFFATPNTSS